MRFTDVGVNKIYKKASSMAARVRQLNENEICKGYGVKYAFFFSINKLH